MHLSWSFLIRHRSLQYCRTHFLLRKLFHSNRLHDARLFVHRSDAPLPRDFRRRASPIPAVIQLQVAVMPRLGRNGGGGRRGVIVIVPLPHRFGGSSHRHQAGEAVSRAASARPIAAAPAGACEVELRGDLRGKVPEEVRHCEQRAAGDARGDFCHTRTWRIDISACEPEEMREKPHTSRVPRGRACRIYPCCARLARW